MEPGLQWFLLSLALFLVFLNGYFVATEFAIVKVRLTRIQELLQSGKKRAGTALKLVENMDEYLSATQLGITLASLGLGWVGEPAFAHLIKPLFTFLGSAAPAVAHSISVFSAFMVITFLHIVLGELAPKSLAIQRPESVVLWGGRPLVVFHWITYPFIKTLNGTANVLLRLIGVTPLAEGEEAHSEEELKLILAQSTRAGILEGDEQKMLERVLVFSDRLVRQVMVPSNDVVYLDVQKPLSENLETARRRKHTRYPLCDGGLEQVLGLVHTKELFWKMREMGDRFELTMAKKSIRFAPDIKPIKTLLSEFQSTQTHMAVVIDEYGTAVGIATLEDILEELVGEIQDEFDPILPFEDIRRTGRAAYLVHGRTLLEELESRLEIDLADDENDTIGGHVMMKLGRPAEVGDTIAVAGCYRVRVVGIKGFQITDLRFEKKDDA